MPRPVAKALLALTACLSGALAHARSSDRNQPMDLDADRQDCTIGNDNAPCIFTGDVVIVQGTLKINAAKADVRRAGGDIQRVLLSGAPVTMTQQTDNGATINARASNVDYTMSNDTVVFTGNAQIDQPGRGSIRGERIVYNMTTSQVQSGGQGNGRTSVRLLPKSAQNAPQKPAPQTPAPPAKDDRK